MAAQRDWRALFEATYAGDPSAVAERVWRQVYGDDYPVGVDPFSYISKRELERFAEEVRVGPEESLVDLGCGRGGPGLWGTMATGTRLIGVDIADNAVAAARERARSMGLGERTEFRQGSFADTGIPEDQVGAVMSVDGIGPVCLHWQRVQCLANA